MTTSSSTTSSPPAPSPSGEAAAEAEAGTTLDLTGEVCPYTFVRTRLALEALDLGSELSVIVDHAPAARNVPRSAAEWGQEVIGVEERGGTWAIRLRKRVS